MADQTPETHQRRAEVIPLRPEGRVGNEVVHDAEIVDEEPRQTYNTRRLPSVPDEVRQKFADVAVTTTRASVPVVTRAARGTARHMLYIAAGVAVIRHRRKEARTTDPYVRAMHAAEAAGDWEAVERWADRIERAKNDKHRRRMDLIKSPKEIAKALVIAASVVPLVLLAIGVAIAINTGDIAAIAQPFKAVADAVAFAVWFVTAYGVLLAGGGTVALLWYLNRLGKRHGERHMPARFTATTAAPDGRDMVPDEGAILAALRELGYAPLTKAFKEGWQPRWVSPTTRVGKGWHAQLLLPRQVPVEEIAKRKSVLAHNLLRKPIEVWPTEPKDQPGVLDLWVADQGVLTGPVPEWPLLHAEGTTDYFKGVPVAVDMRGEQVTAQLMARNYLIAGIMGSGKSSLVICLLLGAMLDPLVEIDVHVLAYNVDYDPMKPRLRSLVKGDEEEHVEAAIETLRALAAEVSERGRILEELGGEEAKVTRDLAERDARLRPRVVVFDEVQELFTHKKYGEEAKELALKVTKKARKTAITLLWVTPDADAASLPRGISKTASNRVAFAINDHQGNDAILGTGMHKAGYSATTLVAGEDVGTAMAAGFAKKPGLIRSYYVRKEKGVDEVTPVVERAVALRAEHGVQAAAVAAEVTRDRDLLEDLAAVLDVEPVRAGDALGALRKHAPSWKPYRDLTVPKLVAALADRGVKVPSTGNKYPIDPARVRAALAKEATADLDDEG